ncbi:MAG: hypothetical protein MJA29_10280 [Candidatus Omnitrophica bacterium]|nr:hypothetical protein [Candidatus Omnitrophota bacterium]
MENVEQILAYFFNVKSLVSSLMGAFSGALFAYWFNIRQHEKRRKDDQLSFLTYAISSMAGVVGKLYIAKKNFVIPRNNEMKKIKEELASISPGSGGQVAVKMKALTMFMQTNKIALPFSIEKINFLAGKEPNVAYLICTLNASLEVLNQIIYDYNAYLSKIVQIGSQPNISLIFHFVDNLSGQVDEALYLAEKMQEVLMQYSRAFFKKDFKIKSVDIKEEYLHLKPPKMPSWEEAVFFPRKKSFIEKLRNSKKTKTNAS